VDCVDTHYDEEHCGNCETACATPGETCLARHCRALGPDSLWELVSVSLMEPGDAATAHSLAVDDVDLWIAWVSSDPASSRLKLSWFLDPDWLLQDPPSVSDALVSDAVSLRVVAMQPYLAWSEGTGTTGAAVHVAQWNGAVWSELGAPGWTSACTAHRYLDLALGDLTSHVVAVGASACAGTVEHRYRDISLLSWEAFPGPGGVSGELTTSAAGRPSVLTLYGNQPFVGLVETGNGGTTHTVIFSDGNLETWWPIGDPLDVNDASGTNEDLAMTTDETDALWVAWAETRDASPFLREVYAAYLDPGSWTWTRLGDGPVNDVPGAGQPSILVTGDLVWVAYVDESGATAQARVALLDLAIGAWGPVGGSLNEDPDATARAPEIGFHMGRPSVAFREGPAEGAALHVKTLQL
jgi:hypothetical protein